MIILCGSSAVMLCFVVQALLSEVKSYEPNVLTLRQQLDVLRSQCDDAGQEELQNTQQGQMLTITMG